MPIKVNVSYTPDEEAKITRLEALLKSLLPRHKVKKSTGKPPYNHLYFTPKKPGKSCNIRVFDDLKKG